MNIAEVIYNYAQHQSIQLIKEKDHAIDAFLFKAVSPHGVLLKLNQLNIRKACRFDYIPAKLLTIGESEIYTSLAPIINASIASSIYPNDCKKT